MTSVVGMQGYERDIAGFAKASFGLSFEHINADFLAFLPEPSARVLDVGCGVGQNAAALSLMNYDVTAIEPMSAFLALAKAEYSDLDINWIDDCLPALLKLDQKQPFDFILLDGVWHHLSFAERRECVPRLAQLLSVGGVCALSLRHGPAGLGSHVFPTSSEEVKLLAEECGLKVLLELQNQPSKMPNKDQVMWSRLVLQK